MSDGGLRAQCWSWRGVSFGPAAGSCLVRQSTDHRTPALAGLNWRDMVSLDWSLSRSGRCQSAGSRDAHVLTARGHVTWWRQLSCDCGTGNSSVNRLHEIFVDRYVNWCTMHVSFRAQSSYVLSYSQIPSLHFTHHIFVKCYHVMPFLNCHSSYFMLKTNLYCNYKYLHHYLAVCQTK